MADGNSTGDADLDALLNKGTSPKVATSAPPHAPTGDADLDAALAQGGSKTPGATHPAMSSSESMDLGARSALLYGMRLMTPQGFGEVVGGAGLRLPMGIVQGGADIYNLLHGRGVHDPNRVVVPNVGQVPSTQPGMPSMDELQAGIMQGAYGGYQAFKPTLSPEAQSAVHNVAEYGPEVVSALGTAIPTARIASRALAPIGEGLANIGQRAAVGIGNAAERALTGKKAAPLPPPATGAGFGADTASAARANDASLLPEDMQDAAQDAIDQHGRYNPEAATRYSEAHEYNPNVAVSPGEATRIPSVLREEYDDVNATARGAQRIANNSRNFAATMEADRNAVAPNSNHTDAQLASRTIGALRTEGNELVEDAKAAYGALEAFGNGSMPIDMDAIVRGTEGALDVSPIGGPGVRPKLGPLEAMRTKAQAAQQVAAMRAAGQEVPADLLRQSQMTVSDYTGFGRILAEIQRGNDPIQRYMAGAMRDQLEQLPLTQESGMPAQVQEVANTARGIWKHLKDREAEDPAFNEVRNGTPNADTFMSDHFSDANGIEQVQRTLGGNHQVAQDIAAYHANRLIKAARLDADAAQTGKLAASSLGNAVNGNEATLNAAFGNQGMERFQLGARVARTLTPDYASAGANISRSGTTGVQRVGRGLINAAIDSTTVGRVGRAIGEAVAGDRAQRALMRRTLDQPYAGLGIHGSPMADAAAESNLQPRTNPNPARERYLPPAPHGEPVPQLSPNRPGSSGGPVSPPPQAEGASSATPPQEGPFTFGAAPTAPAAATVPNPLPLGPRAPLSAVGAGLQARRGGVAQARADYRARMQQIADEHIGRWGGQNAPAASTPATGPVAPPPAATLSGRVLTPKEQEAAAKMAALLQPGTMHAPIADPRVLDALQAGTFKGITSEEIAAGKAVKPPPKPKGLTMAQLLEQAKKAKK